MARCLVRSVSRGARVVVQSCGASRGARCGAQDGTRFSSKIRLANHSAAAPNACAKTLAAGGNTRIGMFALRDVSAGEEVLFNYGGSCDKGAGSFAFCKRGAGGAGGKPK